MLDMQPKNGRSFWRRAAIIALTLAAMVLPGSLAFARGKSYGWVTAWPSRPGARPSPELLKKVGPRQLAKWMIKTPSGQLRFPAKRELPGHVIKKAVNEVGLQAMALRHDKVKSFKTNYRVKVPLAKSRKTSPDQKGSGRCWDFAGTLSLESMVKAKQGKDVKLSENFINYHALRRMAFGVLGNAGDYAARRIKREALSKKKMKTPKHHRLPAVQQISEGGFAGWYYPMVKDHGMIPESAYPSNMPANNSSDYVRRVRTVVANALLSLDATSQKGDQTKILRQARKDVVEQLNLALGKPPKQFFIEGKRYTPHTYRKKYLKLQDKDLDMVVLSNNPTTAFNRRYLVSGFPGMPKFEIHNVSIKTITGAAKKALREGQALYFSTTVSRGNPHVAGQRPTDPKAAAGLLSLSAFDYSFLQPKGTRELPKGLRLKAGELRANHAMSLIGYDTKNGLRWLVQNSYGDDYGDHGRMHMHQDFFKYYTSSVAVPRAFVPKKALLKTLARPLVKSRRRPIVDL